MHQNGIHKPMCANCLILLCAPLPETPREVHVNLNVRAHCLQTELFYVLPSKYSCTSLNVFRW